MTRIIYLLLPLIISSCAIPIKPHSEPTSYALKPSVQSGSWELFSDNFPDDNENSSWFSVLNTGEESLARRLALIDSAEVAIDAQYFLWLEDVVGSLSFERLLAAADRGVRVRLLLDDSFLAGEDAVILALAEHPNMHVRIYNPFATRSSSMTDRYIENMNDFSRTNHRMHNKLLIGDSTVAVIGGRNIADEYFGFGVERNFRDFELLAAGSIVPDLAEGFDIFWNSGWAFPVPEIEHKYANNADFNRLKNDLRLKASRLDNWQATYEMQPDNWADLANVMVRGQAELLIDKPHFEEKLPTEVSERLLQTFRASEEEIIAISAYLVMTDELLNSTLIATNKGVKVSFLTNSLASTNHVAAYSAYRHHRKAILKTGANLFTVRSDAASRTKYEVVGFTAEQFGLHGKVTIIDSDQVFVGTLNLDPRSMFLNTEMGLLIDSPELNTAIREALLIDFSPNNSWKLELSNEGDISWSSADEILTQQPAGNIGQRIMDFIFGLFPIDSEM